MPKCELTGVGVQAGNNVSHSQRKTRRRFLPNLKKISALSDILGQECSLVVTARCIRSMDKAGGFDNFILKARPCKMSDRAKAVRKKILKIKATRSA